ncbi:MAG: UDP-2,3-diacylglucosamine diphosphatase [Acidobacteriota bacterium]|nr:UDP-2,3-diacylglucosamine diphosphatase [Acidobacteriota bacterium]
MAFAVVADAHLGGPGGPADPLVRQLDDLRFRDCEQLVLLGDLFQVWVGNPRFETADIAAVVAALRRVREDGIPVHYIEGNRDFFVAGSSYENVFDTVGDELAITSGGKRYLAIHGDGINEKDHLYRFWRRVSKNRLSRMAMNRLPLWLARRLVFGFERELGKTNFKHKKNLPQEVILDFARSRLAEGFDALILGHFHEPFRRSLDRGEVIVLDAWFRSQRVEWLAGGAEERPSHGSA